jgi:hypothetical protein
MLAFAYMIYCPKVVFPLLLRLMHWLIGPPEMALIMFTIEAPEMFPCGVGVDDSSI